MRTKKDWRVVGRPHRGARRFMVMKSGFSCRTKAQRFLVLGQSEGWLSPDAYVRSQRVVENRKPVDHTADIRKAAIDA